MTNTVRWVEIPALDIQRAAAFYSAIYAQPLSVIDLNVRKLVLLPNDNGGVGASLNETENFPPGDKGILLYLDAGDDLTPMLDRVLAAGGKVISPKTDLGGNGFFAVFRDSEGNHLALMSTR